MGSVNFPCRLMRSAFVLICIRLANVLLDVIADHVCAEGMAFLDAWGCGGWDSQGFIGDLRHRSTVLSTECDSECTNFLRGIQCIAHVLAVSGGGDSDDDIAGGTECFNLPLEDAIVTIVVPDSRQYGRVGGQGNRWQCPALFEEATDKFGCHVLGIRRAAAIPAPQDFVAVEKAPAHLLSNSLQLRDRLLESLNGFQVLFD